MNTQLQTKGGGPTAQHTPTPWHMVESTICTAKPDSMGDNVASCHYRESEGEHLANAAFIVTACNSYESDQRRIKELEGALEYRLRYDTDPLFAQQERERAFMATAGNMNALEAWEDRARAALKEGEAHP